MQNRQNDPIVQRRMKRTRYYRTISILLVLITGTYLLFSLTSLIMPIIIGILLAYISLPVTEFMQRRGIPKLLSVILLVGTFLLLSFYAAILIRNMLPDANDQIRLKVVAMHQLNDRYQAFMNLGKTDTQPNILYTLLSQEVNPVMDNINAFLVLSEGEKAQFERIFPRPTLTDRTNERLWNFHESNLRLRLYSDPGVLLYESVDADSESLLFRSEESSNLSLIMNLFSIWLVMPIMYFFFLLDDGKLRKSFISLTPNMFFEMTLTSLKNVDNAIGAYLRGTVIETLAVFITFLIVLLLIGFSFTASLFIGLAAAILNIIPIIGSFAGIALCLVYALILDDVNSVIPIINSGNIVIFAVLAGLFVQLIDNAAFKPYILGTAVDLHPVLVIISVIAGGTMFGFWGILFAVPVVVIVKVVIETLNRQLKLYYIID